MTLRLLVGDSENNLDALARAARSGAELDWPAPKDSERDDFVLLFIPAHGFVGHAAVVGETTVKEGFHDREHVYWATIGRIQLLEPPVALEDVQRYLPVDEWPWPTHHRRSYYTPVGDTPLRLLNAITELSKRSRATPTPAAASPPPPQAAAPLVEHPELIGSKSDLAVDADFMLKTLELARSHYLAAGFQVEPATSDRPHLLRCARTGVEVRVEVAVTRVPASRTGKVQNEGIQEAVKVEAVKGPTKPTGPNRPKAPVPKAREVRKEATAATRFTPPTIRPLTLSEGADSSLPGCPACKAPVAPRNLQRHVAKKCPYRMAKTAVPRTYRAGQPLGAFRNRGPTAGPPALPATRCRDCGALAIPGADRCYRCSSE